MNAMFRPRAHFHFAAALVAALLAMPAAAQQPRAAPGAGRLPARLEVVGRGPVTSTRTTDLVVFTGANGRDYAYTGTFGACQGCAGNKLYVWDVSDPATPALTDSIVVDAAIVNDVAVNREGTLAVLTREGARSRRNGIVVLDLADPAHPRVASEYWETLLGGVHNAFIDGHYAYVVDTGPNEMAIIDLSDPRDPREVGRWGVPYQPERYLHDVFVRDGLAYLAYWDDGLVILDVGEGRKEGSPEKPKLISQYRYRTEWRGARYGNTHFAFPYTTKAGKKYVFVGDEIFPDRADLSKRVDTGGYIHVLDVTNPEGPNEVATYEAPGSGVNNFWIDNDTLYVGAYSAGLRVVDLSGDIRGSLRGREVAALLTVDDKAFLPDLPFTWAAMPHKGLVYATDFNSGLWIARVVPVER
ncbi:MAG TPA: hypothetical protein VFQ39_00725 [Longimicrobium sp.]|nr:hypothetical protein [Longimicrobium sp.]